MRKENEIELLKTELDQKKFLCTQENSRFLIYIIFLIGTILTGNFDEFNGYWLVSMLFLVITGITLKRILKLRGEIKEKYNKLFELLKK